MSTIDSNAINYNLLPALAALLSERSVSAAAKRVHVTQSAMSHSLAKLRLLLDDPILVAAGRGSVLTPRAEQLSRELPAVLEKLQRLLQVPTVFDPATTKRAFRIATVDYFEFTMLPSVLAYLQVHAPHVTLEILRFVPSMLQAIAAGEIDLALVGGTMTAPVAGLSHRVLYRDPFAVLVRRDHPVVKRTLDLETYLSLGHVLVSVEGRRDGVVDRALAAMGRSRNVVLRVPHFVSAPMAVLQSDLLCTIANTVAMRARDQWGLRVFEPPLQLGDVPIVALWSKAHDDDPASQWFRGLFGNGRVFDGALRQRLKEAVANEGASGRPRAP